MARELSGTIFLASLQVPWGGISQGISRLCSKKSIPMSSGNRLTSPRLYRLERPAVVGVGVLLTKIMMALVANHMSISKGQAGKHESRTPEKKIKGNNGKEGGSKRKGGSVSSPDFETSSRVIGTIFSCTHFKRNIAATLLTYT